MFIPNTKRNFDGVEFEAIRRKVDPQINELHDELSECYYTYWKHGQSKPFTVKGKTWDVQETPEASHVLFQKLQIALHHTHTVLLERQNKLEAPKDRDAKLDDHLNLKRKDRNGEDVETPLEVANRVLADFKKEGIEFGL